VEAFELSKNYDGRSSGEYLEVRVARDVPKPYREEAVSNYFFADDQLDAPASGRAATRPRFLCVPGSG
jgi:hypothetical protein